MSGGIQVDGVVLDPHTDDPDCEGQLRYNDSEPHVKALVGTRVVRVTEHQRAHQFSLPNRVPGSGLRYLEADGITTSSVPYVVERDSVIRAASITVQTADGSRSYGLDIFVESGPTILNTTVLGVGDTHEHEQLSLAVTEGTELQFRLRRLTGSGRSTFRRAVAEIVFGE